MIPPNGELFRALIRRALGGRDVLVSIGLALFAGVVSGWSAARFLGAGLGTRPSAGMLAWLLVQFPQSALYALGVLTALQIATAYGEDARTGWTVQYLAAGGTRDRYILALALAGGCAYAFLYLLATSAWLGTAALFGRSISLLRGDVIFLPIALAWFSTPAAFAAAAVALTARSGRAVLAMIATVCLPWLFLAALRPDPDAGAPQWLTWLKAISPPYPVAAGIASACLITAYAALLLALAWAAAPRRILRV